jgi:DNA repair protein RecO (recombination protein O)
MYLTVKGIVFDKINVGEYDKIVSLYTLERGKIKTIFKSVNKPTAKLLSLTQIGNEVELQLYYLNDTFLKVTGGILLDAIFEIKQDYEKYVSLCKILEIVDKLTLEFLPDEKKYILLKRVISLLKKSNNPKMIFLAFIFRWLKLCGYQPEIFRCIKCKKPVDKNLWWFDFLNSGIMCDSCAKKNFLSTTENKTKISYYSIQTIQNFYKLSGDEIEKQCIDSKTFSEIEDIVENYLNLHSYSHLNIKN